MHQQTELDLCTTETMPLAFLDYSQNQLGAAIKDAAQALSAVRKQEKQSQKGISNYIKKHYSNSEYTFLYDFYQEKECDTLKFFIENLYLQLEQQFQRQTAPKAQTSKVEFNKQFGLVLGSLIKISNKSKDYFQWVSKVFESVELKPEIKEQFMRNQTEGKKILKQFYQVFVMLDKCIGIYNKSEGSVNEKINKERGTQTEMNPEKSYYSNETFAHQSVKIDQTEANLKNNMEAETQTDNNNEAFIQKFSSFM